MNINIKTKFNVGDKVWIPERYDDHWFVKNKNGYCIHEIKIYINSHNQITSYIVKDNNKELKEYPIRFCFSDYKECQLWCKKENNE